jgi:hypothetical protein
MLKEQSFDQIYARNDLPGSFYELNQENNIIHHQIKDHSPIRHDLLQFSSHRYDDSPLLKGEDCFKYP